jgi:hypothetical protein
MDPKWMSEAREALEKIGAEISISANAPRASSLKPKR